MFCFEILSVDQELATSVATVDSRFVSPVTELLAPPIVSFGHFYHLRFFFFPNRFFKFFLRISKRNYRKSFLFCNIFIVIRTSTYAKNFNEEYIQKPLIYYRSDQVSCHKNWKYTQFWFISNAVNFQPVSNFRFSIVVACECCLISKKSLGLLLSF